MNTGNPLLANLDSLHTTELGALRIKNNLSLTDEDVVEWCRSQISAPGTVITRNGKNGMLGKTLIMWQITVRCCLAMHCHPLSERCPNDLLT